MAASISHRIYRTFFFNSLISLTVVILFVWLVFEDMEDALLARDAREQMQLLRRDSHLLKNHVWQTESLIAAYRARGDADTQLPSIFQGLPVPYLGEVTWQEKIYHIYSYPSDEGDYFIAKDISALEHREYLFGIMLIVLCLIVSLLNFILSIFANRRLVKPLNQLTLQIRNAIPGQIMTPIDTNFADAELVEIASTFNRFIEEIILFIKRERTMIGLASHELRTPTAVISGAVQVIEQRNRLTPEDKKTLERIKQAIQEMEENIETLLALSRRSRSDKPSKVIIFNSFLDGLLEEISFAIPDVSLRIQKNWQTLDLRLQTDPVVAKLLISNLLRNALHHTTGAVQLTLTKHYLDIMDEGPGLPPDVQAWVNRQPGNYSQQEGLGLFIVTLACEQLDWHLESINANGWKNALRLWFSSAPHT